MIERALQLADAGSCRSMAQLRAALKREGYIAVEQNLAGHSISAQLRTRMKSAEA